MDRTDKLTDAEPTPSTDGPVTVSLDPEDVDAALDFLESKDPPRELDRDERAILAGAA